MDKKAEGGKEGSGDLSKEKPKMIAYDIVARNPRTKMHLPVVNLRVLLTEREDHGAFRMILTKSKNVISYNESVVIEKGASE